MKAPNYDNFRLQKNPVLRGFRHYVQWLVAKTLVMVFACLSVRQIQRIGKCIGLLAFHCIKRERGIALYQLSLAFPQKPPGQIKHIAKNCFVGMGQTLTETLALQKIRKNPQAHIRVSGSGTKEVLRLNSKKQPLIGVFAHSGNWELAPVMFEMLGISAAAVYRGHDNERLNDLFRKIRHADSMEYIIRGDKRSARQMIQSINDGKMLCIVLDQDVDIRSVYVDFFGMPAKTPVGAATLAVKFQLPVFVCDSYRGDNGMLEFSFQEISLPPYNGDKKTLHTTLTQQYTSALEANIRQHVDQWIWFHRRWKTSAMK